MRQTPTAPVAGGSFVLGYAVVLATGSRFLGGVVLLLGGLLCARAWTLRHGPRTASALLGIAFVAFVASHLLGLAIGAWPAVLLTAAGMAAAAWVWADGRERAGGAGQSRVTVPANGMGGPGPHGRPGAGRASAEGKSATG
jgi:hypothetical protein